MGLDIYFGTVCKPTQDDIIFNTLQYPQLKVFENYAAYKVNEALNQHLDRLKAWKNELISQKCSSESIVIVSNIVNELENEIKNHERK